MSHFALPSWFWEGDAVITETLLSSSGRGRLPSFERGLRTLILSGGEYDYVTAMLGSYAEFVPDYYVNWLLLLYVSQTGIRNRSL